MRFLADENFPAAAISALTARGSDVISVGAVAPGATDAEVLALAARDGRTLLTFDKDFWRTGQEFRAATHVWSHIVARADLQCRVAKSVAG